MSQGKENSLLSARLVPVPWWRAALTRLGGRKRDRDQSYQQTLERLAKADVTDTVGESDVKSWLKMLDGESKRVAKGPLDP